MNNGYINDCEWSYVKWNANAKFLMVLSEHLDLMVMCILSNNSQVTLATLIRSTYHYSSTKSCETTLFQSETGLLIET
jgi:hypothetical protein